MPRNVLLSLMTTAPILDATVGVAPSSSTDDIV